MNKLRRKEIESLIDKTSSLKEELESVLDTEQEYFDNIPENLQSSERYSKSEEAISNVDKIRIEEAISNLEYAIDNLNSTMEN